MINTFKEITISTEDNFEEYLKRIALFEIFEPIFKKWASEPEIAKGVIQYIFYGYSVDSDQLPKTGNDWKKKSLEIFDKVALPSKIQPLVVGLESPEVQKSIHSFLWYQNDENWTEYCLYRDLRMQMQTYSLLPTAEVKTKMDAAKNSQELLQMMDAARNRFIDLHPSLKKQVEEVTKKSQEKNTKSFAQMLKESNGNAVHNSGSWGAFNQNPSTDEEG